MKPALPILMLVVFLWAAPAEADPPRRDRLAAVAWLVGEWAGTGQGQPGTSESSRHAARVQNDHFIRIEGRSVYRRQEQNPSGEIHTSSDYWSFDRRRNLLILRQFDSLGFVSTYVQDSVASSDGRIVMVSENFENVPAGWRGRYTYEHPAPNEYRELFELDMGPGFQAYVANHFRRIEARPTP